MTPSRIAAAYRRVAAYVTREATTTEHSTRPPRLAPVLAGCALIAPCALLALGHAPGLLLAMLAGQVLAFFAGLVLAVEAGEVPTRPARRS